MANTLAYSSKSEKWEPVNGYELLYEVSSLGRIRSFDRKKRTRSGVFYILRGRMLRPTLQNSKSYFTISLTKNGVEKTKYIHRLVLIAFSGYLNKSMEGNHLNGKKFDNRIHNLEWATRSENLRHSYATGLRKHWTSHGK